MEWILFLTFFTSPATAKDHPVWSLQSTQQVAFATRPACIAFGKHLQEQFDATQTVTMRGWCVDQGTGISTFAAPNPFCKDDASAAQSDQNKSTDQQAPAAQKPAADAQTEQSKSADHQPAQPAKKKDDRCKVREGGETVEILSTRPAPPQRPGKNRS